MQCGNECGEKIRRRKPSDPPDDGDSGWVHEDGSPYCDLTMVARPPEPPKPLELMPIKPEEVSPELLARAMSVWTLALMNPELVNQPEEMMRTVLAEVLPRAAAAAVEDAVSFRRRLLALAENWLEVAEARRARANELGFGSAGKTHATEAGIFRDCALELKGVLG